MPPSGKNQIKLNRPHWKRNHKSTTLGELEKVSNWRQRRGDGGEWGVRTTKIHYTNV